MRTQRITGIAAAAMLVSLGLTTAGVASANATASGSTDVKDSSCAAGDARALCAEPESLLNVPVGDVHPTQPSLGYDEVYYKLGRYSAELSKDAINKKFDDWCEANGQEEAAATTAASTLRDASTFTCTVAVGAETPATIEPMKTVVVGPGGVLYLTDGHHTLTSFAEDSGRDVNVRLRVLGNLSGLSETDFWDTMQQNKWVWLRDVDGRTITPAELPANVGLSNFQDDRFRSIMYFARDIGYSADGRVPFQEFYWGTWLRGQSSLDVAGWNQDDWAASLGLVRQISEAQVALPQGAVIDAASGYTAADLSALTAWNNGKAEGKGEWAKLSAPYTEAKPGKLAYMTAYRATLPEVPEETLLPAPMIVTPTEGASLTGDSVQFAGTATAGAHLVLTLESTASAGADVAEAAEGVTVGQAAASAVTETPIVVDATGSWTATLALTPGSWSAVATLVDENTSTAVISDPSTAVHFALAAVVPDQGVTPPETGNPGDTGNSTDDPATTPILKPTTHPTVTSVANPTGGTKHPTSLAETGLDLSVYGSGILLMAAGAVVLAARQAKRTPRS